MQTTPLYRPLTLHLLSPKDVCGLCLSIISIRKQGQVWPTRGNIIDYRSRDIYKLDTYNNYSTALIWHDHWSTHLYLTPCLWSRAFFADIWLSWQAEREDICPVWSDPLLPAHGCPHWSWREHCGRYWLYDVLSPFPRAPATYYLYMYIMCPAPYINNYFVWKV